MIYATAYIVPCVSKQICSMISLVSDMEDDKRRQHINMVSNKIQAEAYQWEITPKQIKWEDTWIEHTHCWPLAKMEQTSWNLYSDWHNPWDF